MNFCTLPLHRLSKWSHEILHKRNGGMKNSNHGLQCDPPIIKKVRAHILYFPQSEQVNPN